MEGTAHPKSRHACGRVALWSARPRNAVPGNLGVVAGRRYYSPGLGRWVSRDPIEEEGGANLLAYLQGDPANGVDVLGLAGMDSVTSSLWAAAVRGDVATIQFLIQQGCLSSTTLALANRLLPMANRINHIFNNPAHNMASLVTAYGNDMMAALNGIQQAAAAAVTGANGSIFTQVVRVQGFSVTVTGRVIDGVAVVSNAWIP